MATNKVVITPDPVSDWQSLQKTFTNAFTALFRRKDNTLFVEAQCSSQVNIGNNWVTLGTLKSTLRPDSSRVVTIPCIDGQVVALQISGNGNVLIRASASGLFWAQGSGVTSMQS